MFTECIDMVRQVYVVTINFVIFGTLPFSVFIVLYFEGEPFRKVT